MFGNGPIYASEGTFSSILMSSATVSKLETMIMIPTVYYSFLWRGSHDDHHGPDD